MIEISCIVIDDEPPSILQIEEYISNVPYLNWKHSFDNAIDALNYLKENTIDLIFLDIQMKKLTGIQFLKVLKSKPKVILTTAYDDYALEAFDLEVSDYLLKPISFERFIEGTEKVYKSFLMEQKSDKEANKLDLKDDRNYFFVKTGFVVERVDFNNILYIKGEREYLSIRTTKKSILTLKSFNDILEYLPSYNFVRIHNTYVVAINKITSIERNHVQIGDEIIPIGPKYKDDFFSLLKNRKLL
ncbi:MAG: LytTR family DNA-binding domain-containing protein [Bacteroidetes bacterium]|nr:LytTR family DNA-binding domain-containing protein [Bacteroidota bacterium]